MQPAIIYLHTSPRHRFQVTRLFSNWCATAPGRLAMQKWRGGRWEKTFHFTIVAVKYNFASLFNAYRTEKVCLTRYTRKKKMYR